MKTVLACALVLFMQIGLFAENRTYRKEEPVGTLIPKIIDRLGDAGFQFTVKNVYNEKRDGKQGFIFLLQPRQTVCELVFFDEKSKASLVRIRTQDGEDSARFHKFFLEKLSMKEVGVTAPPAQDPKWPTP